jgi:hypothetical protein
MLVTPEEHCGVQALRVCGANVRHMPSVTAESLTEGIRTHMSHRHPACSLYGDGCAVENMVNALHKVDVNATQKQYQTPPIPTNI